MRIPLIWIFIASLHKIDPCQAVGLHQTAVLSAKPGESVTLYCTFEEKLLHERKVWYVQKFGKEPLNVGIITSNENHIISPEFQQSRFKLNSTMERISLIISRVTKEDEGMYFCGISTLNMINFNTGTFLAVAGNSQLNISVLQSPVRSVSPGERVTLQCTVLSEIRSADLQVFWFRPAAGQSFPEIIYTHHNSSRQCESSSSSHSYMYNFSKNILNHSDTGTYYCAVSTCGKILFGNGTTVDLTKPPVVIILGAALGICLIVIPIQAYFIYKRRVCKRCNNKLQQDRIIEETTKDDAEELNYVALNFHKNTTKKGRRVKKEQPQECFYSEVRCPTVN